MASNAMPSNHSNAIPNINMHPDQYHLSSRQRQHRMHYSRLKSAAITASYRLMQCSPDNVLVRKTANAAVNGCRPHVVKAAIEHKQQVEPDVVEDSMYNHRPNVEPIVEICLVPEPTKKNVPFNPPTGYEFVLPSTIATAQDNDMGVTKKPILCGSGEKYFLCYKRRKSKHERPITDIQVTFKSNIPLGYQPLSYLFDGTKLPYFQRKIADDLNNNNNDQKSNNNNDQNQKSNNKKNDPNASSSVKDGSNKNTTSAKNQDPNKNKASDDLSSKDVAANGAVANGGNVAADNDNNQIERIDFDNIPLIIFSRTGSSSITDLQLKELGNKMREGWISVDLSLDGNVANLNKGTSDTSIRPIYISYANDLIAYRFSKSDLNRHINLKYLTPLLVSLHLRKSDLAITAIDSLKYLLLSNFVRFRDHKLMITSLRRCIYAVSHSVVTWNTEYHDKLMEMQIIIFQKFIHHLPADCLYSMLASSLIPLKYDLPKKFLKKYIETSFSYIRILEFGDSLSDTGQIQKNNLNQVNNQNDDNHNKQNYFERQPNNNSNNIHPLDKAYDNYMKKQANNNQPNKPYAWTPGNIQIDDNINTVTTATYNGNGNKQPDDNNNTNLFTQMTNFTQSIINTAINNHIAESSIQQFFQTSQFDLSARDYVSTACRALFVRDRDLAWKPLSCMIIFLCRTSLSPDADADDNSNTTNVRCRYTTRLLEKIIDTACSSDYVSRMPSSFKYLLRCTISRTISYNLCNVSFEYEDMFNANLRFFEKICLNWYTFFQNEIYIILTSVILPSVLERFTPFRRRQKFLSCISRILQHESTLISLVYSLDIIYGRRCIHSIVDSLIGILIETASILKHADAATFEIADQSSKSYTNNYNFHHLAIQCLTYLCKSYSTWFNNEIIRKNSNILQKKVSDALYGSTERIWLKWLNKHMLELKAKDIACDIKDDKAVKHAIALLKKENLIFDNSYVIAQWLHKYRFDIPLTNMGDYLGGSRPKKEKPLEEGIRQWYIRLCSLNFLDHIEIVFGFFLTNCGFRMPKEAQKIERILESFGSVYTQNRPSLFLHPDAAFVVFNAFLMLNTSLHNPKIKQKDRLKINVFTGMCLGVDNQNLNETDYQRVYYYVKNNPYEISFEDEDKAAARRQFDEWKYKSLKYSRKPLYAFDKELSNQMKTAKKQQIGIDRAMSMKLNLGAKNSNKNKSHLSSMDVISGSGANNSVSLSSFPSKHQLGSPMSMDFNDIIRNPDADYMDTDGLMTPAPMQPAQSAPVQSLVVDNDNKIDDNDDDDINFDDEQKEIEKQMRETFNAHKSASIASDELEYILFCSEILTKSFFHINNISTCTTDLIYYNNSCSVELGCLLIDNWWPRILDALKIVFELNDDPYTTPLVLSILPHFLQITLTLGAFGHSSCRIAFRAISSRYRIWWLNAIRGMDEATKQNNSNIANESSLKLIASKIWEKPQKYYEKLKIYILASQHIVHSRTIWLRLTHLQFQFPDVYFMLKGREFIGEQTILKMGARDTTYRLFFFNDMLLYANGKPGKYRSHRVLLLIFCALENLKDSKNVTNAFRIHSPQKSITIALPNNEYKKICFKKINELILKQRKKIRLLISNLGKISSNKKSKINIYNNNTDKQERQRYKLLYDKYQNTSAFLHQTIETIEKEKNPLPQNCKLCLAAFNKIGRRKKECPVCKDLVCPKCIQRKAKLNLNSNKRKNVCDGCLDIVEGRLKL